MAEMTEHEDNTCPTCGRRLTGRKQFEGYMAKLFTHVLRLSGPVKWDGWVLDRGVTAKEIREKVGGTFYARVGDLKYWGLLEQKKEWNHYGLYQITELAKGFVSGRVRIPQFVEVAKGEIVKSSHETVSFFEAAQKDWNDISGWISDWIQPALTRGENGQLTMAL